MDIHVVSNLELLHVSVLLLRQLPDDKGADRVARIALLRVCLDHYAAIDLGSMVVLVLVRIVGVYGVTHVGTHKEGTCDGLRVGRWSW